MWSSFGADTGERFVAADVDATGAHGSAGTVVFAEIIHREDFKFVAGFERANVAENRNARRHRR